MPRRRTLTALLVLAAAGASAAPAAGATRVVIDDFAYGPQRVVVDRGSRVTWVNRDSTNHTVTFRARRPGNLGNVGEGERASARFKRGGSYRYVCAYHLGMRGRVVVR